MQKNTKSQIELSLLLGGQALRKRFPLKYGWLVLLLAVVVLWIMFSNPNVADHIAGKLAQLKNKVPTTEALIPTTRTLKRPTEPPKPTSFCSFHSVLPEDALELEFLKNYITWPETPSVPANFCLNDTSHPAHSTFTILPRDGGGSWHVGDQLEVLIKINDFLGRPKKSGGDVLFARLHNRTVQAGVVGKVFDHRNGSYTAVFSLLWEGSAQVEVTLVHSSEAVTVLERVNLEKPGRIFFQSLFRSGSVTEDANCNVCLKAPPEQLCNFTDTHTGEPWFCYKPKTLKCEHRVSHAFKGLVPHPTGNEAKLFQSGVNLKVSIPSSGSSKITILPKLKVPNETVPVNMSAMRGAGPAGYYYQGAWRALDGTTVHQFNNATAISQCLKGKVLHLYGDSTVRQWIEFLIAKVPDLKKFDLKTPPKTGPLMALDYKNNILLTFRCHGPPLRAPPLPVSQFHFVANELDSVVGGTNTVVIFGVWAHFGVYPVEVYIRRLLSIRRAVVRLLTRAPDTLVIIRTGNPKKLTLRESLTTDDYYALQRDKILRAIFKEVNVRLLDAWEMTQAHYLPHDLHPPQPIIKNMIDVILSHICSQR
ncbi:NXPE family member 3-like isoform X2 [Xiphophorus couchianus]|uniref:NXPE family member 3-like isoform X2 n=2 Tax=Xiphophorus couchianus TaxID=32473 RepID=UPI001016ADA3|nr:NXPE family member 3-like isoform X2 [Xiphophorus couchianus]